MIPCISHVMKNRLVYILIGLMVGLFFCTLPVYSQDKTVSVNAGSRSTEDWKDFYRQVYENYRSNNREEVLKLLRDNGGYSWDELTKSFVPEYGGFTRVRYVWRASDDILQCAAITAPPLSAPDEGLDFPDEVPEPMPEDPGPEREGGYTPAIKTNLLYDAATVLNASLELPIGRRFSLIVEDVFPWWKWGENKNQYCVQIWEIGFEPRWWFKSNGNLKGHFIGLYGKSAMFDLQYDRKFCYQGEYWSAGVSYGYACSLGRYLQIEFSVSVGYMPITYRQYMPDDAYEHLYLNSDRTGTLKYFGPTKASISLVLPISFRKKN